MYVTQYCTTSSMSQAHDCDWPNVSPRKIKWRQSWISVPHLFDTKRPRQSDIYQTVDLVFIKNISLSLTRLKQEMARYLSVLASVLVFSLTVSALPQSAQNNATATMTVSGSNTEGSTYYPLIVNKPRQIHNADYGSGGGPSGNPGSPPPASTGSGPAATTAQGRPSTPSEPSNDAADSTAGQKRDYAPYPAYTSRDAKYIGDE